MQRLNYGGGNVHRGCYSIVPQIITLTVFKLLYPHTIFPPVRKRKVDWSTYWSYLHRMYSDSHFHKGCGLLKSSSNHHQPHTSLTSATKTSTNDWTLEGINTCEGDASVKDVVTNGRVCGSCAYTNTLRRAQCYLQELWFTQWMGVGLGAYMSMIHAIMLTEEHVSYKRLYRCMILSTSSQINL